MISGLKDFLDTKSKTCHEKRGGGEVETVIEISTRICDALYPH